MNTAAYFTVKAFPLRYRISFWKIPVCWQSFSENSTRNFPYFRIKLNNILLRYYRAILDSSCCNSQHNNFIWFPWTQSPRFTFIQLCSTILNFMASCLHKWVRENFLGTYQICINYRYIESIIWYYGRWKWIWRKICKWKVHINCGPGTRYILYLQHR